jgi:hypothetical protein
LTSTTKETEPTKIGSANGWIEYLVDPNNRMLFAVCCRRQGQRSAVLNISALIEAYGELRSKYTGLEIEFRPNKHRAEICSRGRVTDDERGTLIGPRELARVYVDLVNEVIARKEARWATPVSSVVG